MPRVPTFTAGEISGEPGIPRTSLGAGTAALSGIAQLAGDALTIARKRENARLKIAQTFKQTRQKMEMSRALGTAQLQYSRLLANFKVEQAPETQTAEYYGGLPSRFSGNVDDINKEIANGFMDNQRRNQFLTQVQNLSTSTIIQLESAARTKEIDYNKLVMNDNLDVGKRMMEEATTPEAAALAINFIDETIQAGLSGGVVNKTGADILSDSTMQRIWIDKVKALTIQGDLETAQRILDSPVTKDVIDRAQRNALQASITTADKTQKSSARKETALAILNNKHGNNDLAKIRDLEQDKQGLNFEENQSVIASIERQMNRKQAAQRRAREDGIISMNALQDENAKIVQQRLLDGDLTQTELDIMRVERSLKSQDVTVFSARLARGQGVDDNETVVELTTALSRNQSDVISLINSAWGNGNLTDATKGTMIATAVDAEKTQALSELRTALGPAEGLPWDDNLQLLYSEASRDFYEILGDPKEKRSPLEVAGQIITNALAGLQRSIKSIRRPLFFPADKEITDPVALQEAEDLTVQNLFDNKITNSQYNTEIKLIDNIRRNSDSIIRSTEVQRSVDAQLLKDRGAK